MDIITDSKTRPPEEVKKEFRDKAWQDHSFFCKSLFPEAFFVPFSRAHLEIIDLMFDPGKFVSVIAPRKFGKTPTICFSYPLKNILYNLESYIVIVSATATEATRHVQKIRMALESNEKIQYYYGNFIDKRSLETQKDSMQLVNGIWVRAKGLGSQIRGTGGDWSPPSLIIVDDPQSNKDVKTANALKDAGNWFEDEVIFSIAKKWKHKHHNYIGNGKVRFLGTSLHPLCLAEKLDKDTRFKSKRYSIMMNEQGEADHINGKSIWEEMFTTEELIAEWKQAERDGVLPNWLQERQNQPYKYGDRSFNVDDMMYWDVGDNKFDIFNGIPIFLQEHDLGMEFEKKYSERRVG